MRSRVYVAFMSVASIVFRLALASSGAVKADVDVDLASSVSSYAIARSDRFESSGDANRNDACGAHVEATARATLCVAFLDKMFVQNAESEVHGTARSWVEYGSDGKMLAHYIQSHVADDASLIQIYDRSRELRIFLDARDGDSVLAYWCTARSPCIWKVLVADGELRRGFGIDCENLRQFDQARHIAATTIRRVDPIIRVASNVTKGGVAMVTAGTQNLAPTSDLSSELNAKYAEIRGYSFYVYKDIMVPKRIVTWNKVRVVMDMLNRTGHEWIMWLDTDAVVTNRSVAVEDIVTDAQISSNLGTVELILCNDIGGWEVNTGVMLWRNSNWSREILQQLWNMEHLPHMQGAEQAQLIKLLRLADPEKLHHQIMDQTIFNTHPNVHKEGMFIIHMMGMSGNQRVEKFTKIRERLDGL